MLGSNMTTACLPPATYLTCRHFLHLVSLQASVPSSSSSSSVHASLSLARVSEDDGSGGCTPVEAGLRQVQMVPGLSDVWTQLFALIMGTSDTLGTFCLTFACCLL